MDKLFKRLSLVGVAVLLSTAGNAADLPPPIIEHIPHVPAAAPGGFYLRGDIGYKIYGDPSGSFNDPIVGDLRFQRESVDDTWMVGLGVGYKFNSYLRTDLTVDYEAPAQVKGYAPCFGCVGGFSTETADIDVWTVMLNGYLDIGTWNNITPYVGGGIGAAWVNTSGQTSVNPGVGGTTTTTYDGSNSEWNFAWALMAGASYAVTPNFAIDAGYRYKDLGEAKTVRLHDVGTGSTRIKYEDLTAHEFRLGARYTFNTAAPAPSFLHSGPISSNF
ncbi:outer surface protein [Roseibium aquae]|uniref:Outer surface protein n=1 Tax=Roseibium aquae TaxID=1323746 RepID=A0A916T5Y3_9HYPH|nr:outer membrane protein [Roseibium aquae]GGB32928.1 outer surface protein [Roseibium aquae]